MSENYYSILPDSPLGRLYLTAREESLSGLWFSGEVQEEMLIQRGLKRQEDIPVFVQAKDWLAGYFRGDAPDPAGLVLKPQGSRFQRMIWEMLLEIPYGQVTTYGWLAQRAGEMLNKPKMSAQAVGGAVGKNPISIIIPCHRVMGAGGNLTGYGGGLDRKLWLLKREGVDVGDFFMPRAGKYSRRGTCRDPWSLLEEII